MNKKAYIAPEMEVTEMTSEVLMNATSVAMYGEEVDTSKEGGQLGHGRRGSWGNLWD